MQHVRKLQHNLIDSSQMNLPLHSNIQSLTFNKYIAQAVMILQKDQFILSFIIFRGACSIEFGNEGCFVLYTK